MAKSFSGTILDKYINYLWASPRSIIRKYLLNFEPKGRGINPSGGIKIT